MPPDGEFSTSAGERLPARADRVCILVEAGRRGSAGLTFRLILMERRDRRRSRTDE
jgi:hypothetical protein